MEKEMKCSYCGSKDVGFGHIDEKTKEISYICNHCHRVTFVNNKEDKE